MSEVPVRKSVQGLNHIGLVDFIWSKHAVLN